MGQLASHRFRRVAHILDVPDDGPVLLRAHFLRALRDDLPGRGEDELAVGPRPRQVAEERLEVFDVQAQAIVGRDAGHVAGQDAAEPTEVGPLGLGVGGEAEDGVDQLGPCVQLRGEAFEVSRREPEPERAVDGGGLRATGNDGLEEGAPRVLEAALGRDFILHIEGRVHGRLRREHAEEALAERVNRRDAGAVERVACGVEPLRFRACRVLQLAFEALAHPVLQLRRRALGEGNGD